MEVTSTSNQGPFPLRRPAGDDRIDITRVNRDGIQEATEDISEIRAPREPYQLQGQRGTDDSASAHEQKDSIELSEESRRMLARGHATGETPDARRRERLAELEKSYREGTLNTRERIDRAAAGMLASG